MGAKQDGTKKLTASEGRPIMPTEYIPKSLALDIIARLCTDYSAAYAEISAIMGVFMEDENNERSDSKSGCGQIAN